MAQHILALVLILLVQVQINIVECNSFVSKSFDQLDPNISVAFVSDYLAAVVWKDVANEYKLKSTGDLNTLLKQQHDLNIAYIATNSKMSELWTSVSSEFYKAKMVNFYAFVRGYGQRFHILEDFDIIITSRNLFLEKFRYYQKGSGKRTEKGHLFETSDFEFINVHPFSVYQVDEAATGLNLSVIVAKPSCESSTLLSFDYEPSLFNSWKIMNLTEGKIISDYDMECLKRYNKIEFKLISMVSW